jgi:hypothetical protein
MDNDSYLDDIRKGLKESVDFFSSQDKFIRERWIVTEFLTNLSIPFVETDFERPNSDPPDVVFRSEASEAQFEVKEILDKGRRRHDEYKQALVRANAAIHPGDLSQRYSPTDISLLEVFDRIYSVAKDFAKRKYSLEVRRQLDLLCYVNLKDVMLLVETSFPDISPLAALGYRSVSFVQGYRSCVLCADPSAASFLHVQPGIIHRVTP